MEGKIVLKTSCFVFLCCSLCFFFLFSMYTSNRMGRKLVQVWPHLRVSVFISNSLIAFLTLQNCHGYLKNLWARSSSTFWQCVTFYWGFRADRRLVNTAFPEYKRCLQAPSFFSDCFRDKQLRAPAWLSSWRRGFEGACTSFVTPKKQCEILGKTISFQSQFSSFWKTFTPENTLACKTSSHLFPNSYENAKKPVETLNQAANLPLKIDLLQ